MRLKDLIKVTMTIITTMAFSQVSASCKNEIEANNNWDKTFPKSDKVDHEKITFRNRFGITLSADLYIPKDVGKDKLPGIAVSGPFGAVKEQASGLYAQRLAEEGFLTIAFDPSFTGESSGKPRYSSSMDINTEDFCAAVDYLSCREDVDSKRIGILGICGWGGIAINADALDPRIKASVCVTLYNLTRVTQKGYFDSMDEEARYQLKQRLASQRTEEFRKGGNTTARRTARCRSRRSHRFSETIYRLLQIHGKGLPSPLSELQYGLEHHYPAYETEPESLDCSRRSPHPCSHCSRREGS